MIHADQGHLIILCGLPGSGKSHVARHLACMHDAVRICADDIRAEFGLHPGDASAHQIAHEIALPLLQSGRTVCLDANASNDRARESCVRLAEAAEASYATIVIICPGSVREERMRARRNGSAREDEIVVPQEILRRMERSFRPPVSPGLVLCGCEDLGAVDFSAAFRPNAVPDESGRAAN